MNYGDYVLSGKGVKLTIESGDNASNTVVRNSASLRVLSGGYIENTTAYNSVTISNAGSALSTFLSGGTMIVSNGGVATDVNVYRSARLAVSSGGIATGVTVFSGGNVNADVRGGDDNTLIIGTNESGAFYLSEGVASNFVLNRLGRLSVSGGGIADTVDVRGNGSFTVFSGGWASGITQSVGGHVRADVYGNDQNTVVYGVNENGAFSLSGGIASNFILYDGGAQYVSNGGVAYHTLVNGQRACQFVCSNATASATEVFRAGIMNIYDGGIARDTVVHSGGSMVANDGAVISGATVNGQLEIVSGTGGEDEFGGNAGISDVTVGATGKLLVSKSATFSGKISIGGVFIANAGVSVSEGSVIDFDISGIYPGSEARINNLSLIEGAPDYTVTVSGLQLAGVYVLAGGAADFDRTVTVATDTGNELGAFSVGGEIEYGNFTYSLNLDSDTLCLTIHGDDNIPPEAPTAGADVTTPTNQKVTVTATFSEDTALKQYSFDKETWNVYSDGVVMSANGTVFFRGIDAAGNTSDVTEYTVENIDKEPPAAPTVTSSNTKPTNKNITITATFSKDSAEKQYSIDKKTWSDYTAALSVGENGIYYFRGIDAAGNVSGVTAYTVENIDKEPPAAPMVKSSNTKPTNKNITVTATFSADSVKKQYSTDNKTWSDYTAALTVTKNGTYYFRATDAVGNQSDVTKFKVANIDKTAPAAPTVKSSNTKLTNQNVTITATFSADSEKKQYSTDNKSWKDCSDTVSVGKNGTYYFRSADAAGNVSKVASIKVANIDKTAPAAPTVKSSNTKLTNQNVTITATFSTDSAKKQYSTDNKTWNTYSKALSVGKNGTYYFRGVDAAGNASKVTNIKVANIDKTAPDAPTVKASTTKATNKNVTITATFSKDSAKKQYSADKKTWSTYSKALSVEKNGTYYFRGIDAAGNVSKVTTIKVANIDKTAPAAPKLKASTTKVTNQNVTITATFSTDSAKKQYSTDNKTWKTYTEAVSVGKNGTYYFRGVDEAGNVSKAASLKVANIDKTVPTAPTVKLSTTKVTNKSITITATFSADSAKKQYSTDGKNWKTYSKALAVKANGTYYFRGIDAAGNASKVKSVKIANYADTGNNNWDKATVLTGTVLGTLDTGVDKVDYYDVSDVARLMLDMEKGKTNVSFFDADKKAVTVAALTMADGSARENVSTLTLTANDGTTDNFTIAALDECVKYLKIETADKTVDNYKLAKLA